MERHLRVLSGAFLFYGSFLLFKAFGYFFAFGTIDQMTFVESSGLHMASFSLNSLEPLIKVLMFIESYFALIIGVPALIGGYGLYYRKPWGRYTLLVVSIILLLNFPFGTMIGLYSLWVLTKPGTVRIIHA